MIFFFKASEELEHQNNDLQAQISKLQAEIKKLEFMLDSHSCAKYSHTPQDDHELGLNANLSWREKLVTEDKIKRKNKSIYRFKMKGY